MAPLEPQVDPIEPQVGHLEPKVGPLKPQDQLINRRAYRATNMRLKLSRNQKTLLEFNLNFYSELIGPPFKVTFFI